MIIFPSRNRLKYPASSLIPASTPEDPAEKVESQLSGTWLNSLMVAAAFGLLLMSHVLLWIIPDAPSGVATWHRAATDPERLKDQAIVARRIDEWKRVDFTERRPAAYLASIPRSGHILGRPHATFGRLSI